MQMFIFVGIVAVVVTVLMYASLHWASGMVTKDITINLRAAQSLVSEEAVPLWWVQSFARRAAALRERNKGDQEIAALGEAAREHCLRELDKLVVFFEKNNLTDGDETRDAILSALREQRRRLEHITWQELLSPPPRRSTSEDQTDSQNT